MAATMATTTTTQADIKLLMVRSVRGRVRRGASGGMCGFLPLEVRRVEGTAAQLGGV
jgi:hypothetical protein